MKLEAGTQLGPYKIVGEVGRGGMASVYKAHQPALARYVAVKVLPEFFATEPGFKERFQQEAVAVAQLRHPNILAIFDYGEADGVTYIVTEFVDGGTLSEQMGKPLPLEYVSELLSPVAGALDYAHRRGVLHRDVKPSNVLLQRDGTPVLSDFGLAKMMASTTQRITQSGMIVGTPEYMSPEQCSAEDLTPASDQYALAVVAYEALTGRVPFTAATPVGVLMAQMHNELPPPRTINPDLSDEIATVLVKGLAKQPGDRYKTCHQLIRALAIAGDAPLPSTLLEPATPSTPVPAPLTPPPGPMPTQPNVVAPVTPPATPAPTFQQPPPPVAPVTPPPQSGPPYYTPAPQPQPPAPPYYPPAQPQPPPQPQAYQPRPAYQPPQPQPRAWQPPAARTGSTGLVVTTAVSLAAVVFVALIFFIAAAGTPDDPSTQAVEVWIGVAGLFYSALLLFTLIGVVRKATWGLVLAWVSAAALSLTCVGLLAGVPLGIFAYRTRF